MNNNNKLLTVIGIIVLLLTGSFFLGRVTKKCETEIVTVKVNTPVKEGSFETPTVIKPISSDVKTTIQLRDTIIQIPQVNQELMNKYLALENENNINKKELERFKLYSDAIAINNYKQTFDNKDLSLTIEAKTEGKLLELKPQYTIKSQELTTNVPINKPKEKVFSMNIGAGLTATQSLDKLDPSVHLDLVNKKGAILGASYSVDGVIGVKYTIPLFSIKK